MRQLALATGLVGASLCHNVCGGIDAAVRLAERKSMLTVYYLRTPVQLVSQLC